MRKSNEIHWVKAMAVTAAMILRIISVSYSVIMWINHREEENSFERLDEEAGEIASYMEERAERNREKLELIARVASQYDDLSSQSLWSFLDAYAGTDMMSKLELLLPGDIVLTEGGKRVNAEGVLSFEKEAALGAHITNRETDLTDGSYIVRNYVPVCRNGETVAMLYGVIQLGNLPKELAESPFGGKAAIYIIDGESGDFLLDTWHSAEGGNIWALGERKMAPGYDHEQLKQGLIDGKNGYVVFVSQTVGEYLYFYYEPIQINNWRIALSVPESVTFEKANEVKNVLNIILVFESIAFILYFLWMLRYVRTETSEKQHKLDTINYMYDVEKLLFNAHEKKENVTAALSKIAQILQAERVGLWIVGKSQDDTVFLWKREENAKDQEKAVQKDNIYALLEYFEMGNRAFEADDAEMLRKILPDQEHHMIHNIAAVPIETLDGGICGILASCNMKGKKADASLLESVKFSFGMFCHNLTSFTEAKEQGEKDRLTGLYNRNRYEADLPRIKTRYRKSLACVYLDVNGLHELNNAKGHSAGDTMLKTVAMEIRKQFGADLTYRIGGDEFLVFVPDAPEAETDRKLRKLAETLEKEDYHISAGVQWEEEISSIASLIKAAEKKMYAAKKAYYDQEVHDRRKKMRL
ncbi:MAG TPA: diguanylate cyclase [Candidatus Cottocaccamicrobium excrementipullorum]|nr:diguanylate cyclase [Candidatus Cottocaccamicrobium excrementipullorum]